MYAVVRVEAEVGAGGTARVLRGVAAVGAVDGVAAAEAEVEAEAAAAARGGNGDGVAAPRGRPRRRLQVAQSRPVRMMCGLLTSSQGRHGHSVRLEVHAEADCRVERVVRLP